MEERSRTMRVLILTALALLVGAVGAKSVGEDGSTTTQQSYDTIVVGLGSAGVTAASTLARAGKRVLGLEAQNRVGGRVHTVPVAGGVVELGAEWIHGSHPSRVYDLAIQNNVTLLSQGVENKVFRSDGSYADQDLMEELVEYVFSIVNESPEKPQSLGQFIIQKITDFIKEKKPEVLNDKDFMDNLLVYLDLLVGSYEASDSWNDVSANPRYDELEGDQHLSWHSYGYKTFFDILLNNYNNGSGLPTLEIKLNTEVSQISWSQDPKQSVRVTCKDGVVYTADNVIVTVSLGVLKERHTSLFSNPLPQEKVSAIEKISFGVLGKIILFFSENWCNKMVGFGFLWKTEDKAKVAPEDAWTTKIGGTSCSMGSNNTITLWTSGENAKLVETLPEDVVKRKSMELLRRFVGANITVPEATGILRSSWYTNPFTRGSYTYDSLLANQFPTLRADLGAPLTDSAGTPRVLFAGEATDETHFSTVHGASDSGHREALRLLPNAKI